MEACHSRVVRLAAKHRCLPYVLLNTVVLPRTSCAPSWTGSRRKESHVFNGSTEVPQKVVEVLNAITESRDWSGQTFGLISDCFDKRGKFMLHLTRRWCGECYQACASENIPCWDPLYWASRAVTVCTVHRIPLLEICPWCSSRQPFLPKLPFLDRCDSCGGSLAVVPDAIVEGRCRKGSHQLWLALDCVDLIDAMQHLGQLAFLGIHDATPPVMSSARPGASLSRARALAA